MTSDIHLTKSITEFPICVKLFPTVVSVYIYVKIFLPSLLKCLTDKEIVTCLYPIWSNSSFLCHRLCNLNWLSANTRGFHVTIAALITIRGDLFFLSSMRLVVLPTGYHENNLSTTLLSLDLFWQISGVFPKDFRVNSSSHQRLVDGQEILFISFNKSNGFFQLLFLIHTDTNIFFSIENHCNNILTLSEILHNEILPLTLYQIFVLLQCVLNNFAI